MTRFELLKRLIIVTAIIGTPVVAKGEDKLHSDKAGADTDVHAFSCSLEGDGIVDADKAADSPIYSRTGTLMTGAGVGVTGITLLMTKNDYKMLRSNEVLRAKLTAYVDSLREAQALSDEFSQISRDLRAFIESHGLRERVEQIRANTLKPEDLFKDTNVSQADREAFVRLQSKRASLLAETHMAAQRRNSRLKAIVEFGKYNKPSSQLAALQALERVDGKIATGKELVKLATRRRIIGGTVGGAIALGGVAIAYFGAENSSRVRQVINGAELSERQSQALSAAIECLAKKQAKEEAPWTETEEEALSRLRGAGGSYLPYIEPFN